MKILGLHDNSGCGYYRVILPLGELAKHGHEITLVPQDVPLEPYILDPGEWDVIVGERLMQYDWLSRWRKMRQGSNRLVYENDDDIFNVTAENWVAYNTFKRDDVRIAVEAYAEFADLVTVTVEPLAEIFGRFNPNVAVLPNCVPAEAFGSYQAPDRPLRVGWVGGASHGRDIHMATPAVRRFCRRFPDWQLYLGGTDFRPTFKVPVEQTKFESWRHISDDPADYFAHLDFDIGIAPLLETEFARSKSAIKCIEYGARGIPVVASDAKPYRDYIEHGVNGFLAKTDHEWLKYLSELASDEELRLKMGRSARMKARKNCIDTRWDKWENAYKGMWRNNVLRADVRDPGCARG